MSKPFEIGQKMYLVNGVYWSVSDIDWRESTYFEDLVQSGWLHATREEAEAALERVRKALEGEVFDREEVDMLLDEQRSNCEDVVSEWGYDERVTPKLEDAVRNAPSPLNPK